MITSRPLTIEDEALLQAALDQNEFHPDQRPEYYVGPNKFSKIYEDEVGPIGVLRYTKSLRLATVWCDNNDRERNAASIIQAISDSVALAKESGFLEIIFETNSDLLKHFCTNKLGFEQAEGDTMILYV